MPTSKRHPKRARKLAARSAPSMRWLKAHGFCCVVCGVPLNDAELVPGSNPREPHPCGAHCGALVVYDDAGRFRAAYHQDHPPGIPRWARRLANSDGHTDQA